MEEEIWKPILNLENFYEVSNFGRVRILAHLDKSGKLRKEKYVITHYDEQGYVRFSLKRKPTRIHRLVALHFIPNPNNLPDVNHIDGIKSNNIWTNLEWTDDFGNQQHAFKIGLNKRTKGPNNILYHGDIQVYKNNVLIDILKGKDDMIVKGYNYQCVSNCLNNRQKTHKNLTFKRENSEKNNNLSVSKIDCTSNKSTKETYE